MYKGTSRHHVQSRKVMKPWSIFLLHKCSIASIIFDSLRFAFWLCSKISQHWHWDSSILWYIEVLGIILKQKSGITHHYYLDESMVTHLQLQVAACNEQLYCSWSNPMARMSLEFGFKQAMQWITTLISCTEGLLIVRLNIACTGLGWRHVCIMRI